MVVTLAQVGQLPVAARRANQRDAKGQAIGTQHTGHRQRRVVEQVDEVGVVAQVAVEHHRVGLHLRNGVVRGRGGHQQHVDDIPHAVCDLCQAQHLHFGGAVIGGAVVAAFANDAAHGLHHVLGVRVKKRLNGSVTLCHQRAFVQHGGGLQMRRHVDGHWLATQGTHLRDGRIEGLLGLHVAKEFKLLWHTKLELCRQGLGVECELA